MKAKTIRITNEQHAALAEIAKVEGKSIHAVILDAIDGHVDRRARDPEFQMRLLAHRADAQRVYRRLIGTHRG